MKSKDSNIYCDIDETLIRDPNYDETPDCIFNIDDVWFYKMSNYNLIEKLKESYSDKFIVIWTSNSMGIKYAERVVEVLGLKNHIDLILMKPTKVFDDSPIFDWYQNIEVIDFTR